MITLTSSSLRVDDSFDSGLGSYHESLIASHLPTIYGDGLRLDELFRLNAAENQARASHAEANPEASFTECHRVGRAAAVEELKRVLRDRPVVCCDPAETAPCQGCVGHATSKEVVRPASHTLADESWWSRNSPSLARDFYVEGSTNPDDPYNWTMPASEFRELVEAACFGEPELSDDRTDAFGYVREGGAL